MRQLLCNLIWQLTWFEINSLCMPDSQQHPLYRNRNNSKIVSRFSGKVVFSDNFILCFCCINMRSYFFRNFEIISKIWFGFIFRDLFAESEFQESAPVEEDKPQEKKKPYFEPIHCHSGNQLKTHFQCWKYFCVLLKTQKIFL